MSNEAINNVIGEFFKKKLMTSFIRLVESSEDKVDVVRMF